MHLLSFDKNGGFSLTEHIGKDIPKYAILSHTWGRDNEEVTFRDIMDGTGKEKKGYHKLSFCGEQARDDDLHYFWVDTCCIDKTNSSKLQEAINSMFRWYQQSVKCYVYLSDVSTEGSDFLDPNPQLWQTAFRQSRWFTRGWTLQELIAPRSVEFISANGQRLGDKRSLEQQIYEITGIQVLALRGTPLSQFSVEEKRSWAENRQTTLEVDKAYSLFGIFDIYMPFIYGEPVENAFRRLQEEIDKPWRKHRLDGPSDNLPMDRTLKRLKTQHNQAYLSPSHINTGMSQSGGLSPPDSSTHCGWYTISGRSLEDTANYYK